MDELKRVFGGLGEAVISLVDNLTGETQKAEDQGESRREVRLVVSRLIGGLSVEIWRYLVEVTEGGRSVSVVVSAPVPPLESVYSKDRLREYLRTVDLKRNLGSRSWATISQDNDRGLQLRQALTSVIYKAEQSTREPTPTATLKTRVSPNHILCQLLDGVFGEFGE
jgi:hypothetical protein